MVEGGDELDRLRQQHAVAEHVARHVADAGDGHRLRLDVDVHLAEMALHRLPGAAGGDAHLLVVVALAAAGREGVAEPEACLQRQPVGDVRERRRALVRRDHEIGIVAVVPDGVGRRHHAVAVDGLGQLQHGADEDLVALDALGEPGLAVGGGRQLLRDEPALGADRDDDRVLDLLRLDQPEHLGAEILRPVGPADAAARHLAEAQVQAVDARRMDEDLDERARQGQGIDPRAIELEGDGGACLAVSFDLEEVGPHRRLREVDEAAQDAVVLEARDLPEERLDLGAGGALGFLTRRRVPARIEARVEQRHDPGRDDAVAREGGCEVALRERRPGLTQVAGHRPDHGDVAPAEPGFEDERVERVRFGEAAEQGQQRRLDRALDGGDVEGAAAGPLQRHVVQPDAGAPIGAGRRHVVGALVDDAEAEILEERHPFGQEQAGSGREDLQVDARLRIAFAPVEVDGARPRVGQALERLDVGDGVLGVEGFAIGGVEGVAVARRERTGAPAPDPVGERLAEAVAPRARDRGDAVFQDVALDNRRRAFVAADDVVGSGQEPFRIGRVSGRQAAVVNGRQELADAAADGGIVAVLGDEDEDGHEAIELIDAGEGADARPLRQVHDLDGEAVERVLVDLEQLVARIGVEHVEKRAAGMAARVEAGSGDHLRHLEAEIGHRARRARIGVGREQTDEAQLAAQAPVRQEQLDADVIEVNAAVHARLHVRLGDDERLRAA